MIQKQTIIPGGIESSPTLSYDNWLDYGKPSYYQQQSECMPESKYQFDIMSSKFLNDYMYTND